MAALLLLRRAFPSSLARPAASSSSSYLNPLEIRSSSFSLLHDRRFLPFSTSAATEHSALVRSVVQKSPIFRHVIAPPPPRLPIPDGFPFALTNHLNTLTFTRQDKDEKVKVRVHWKCPILINGSQCYLMDASIKRGNRILDFNLVAGSKVLQIHCVSFSKASKEAGSSLLEDFVKSKGIDKGIVTSLLSLEKNEDELIDCFKPRKEEIFIDFDLPIPEQ